MVRERGVLNRSLLKDVTKEERAPDAPPSYLHGPQTESHVHRPYNQSRVEWHLLRRTVLKRKGKWKADWESRASECSRTNLNLSIDTVQEDLCLVAWPVEASIGDGSSRDPGYRRSRVANDLRSLKRQWFPPFLHLRVLQTSTYPYERTDPLLNTTHLEWYRTHISLFYYT